MNNTPDDISNLHHLMRVRVHKALFARLQNIATEETNDRGEYTSVSDLVRSAIRSWIQTYETSQRIQTIYPKKTNTFHKVR